MKIFKFHVGFFLAVSMLLTSVIPQGAQASVMTDYKEAAVSSDQQIDEVFDRFHYTMAVEWDQKDEAFKAQAESDLAQALEALKASGVSTMAIQKHMEKNLLTGKFQKEYQRFLNALKEQNVSPDEATAMTTDFMEKNYAEGTNFNGGGTSSSRWKVVAAIIIVVVITHLIIRDRDDDDHEHNGDNGKPDHNPRPCHDYPVTKTWGGGYDNCYPRYDVL